MAKLHIEMHHLVSFNIRDRDCRSILGYRNGSDIRVEPALYLDGV
jgi:hypothetical protein